MLFVQRCAYARLITHVPYVPALRYVTSGPPERGALNGSVTYVL